MRKMRFAALLLALSALISTSAFAQQTTGNITGRVLDAQGAAVPGATVTARQPTTGFTRTVTSDEEGVYRLQALNVGVYDIVTELSGFSTVEQKGIVLNVGQTLSIDFELKVAAVAETVTVTGQSPLIEATASSVGGVVDIGRIESMPLNGRQFANLAATIPGVGLGLPLRPDQEHAVLAADQRRQRPQCELPDRRRRQQRRHGRRTAAALPARGDSGIQHDHVALEGRIRPQQRRRDEHRHQERHQQPERQLLHAVPRHGDELHHRDRRGQRSREAGLPPLSVRRVVWRADRPGQGALLLLPPSERSRIRSSWSNTEACSRVWTASSRRRTARISSPGKVTATLTPSQYLSVRYGRNTNTQPYGASPQTPPNGWGTSENSFNSINVNHNWVLGGSS